MSILALIPARAGSKGIKDKNFRRLGEWRLWEHASSCASRAGCVPVLSTDAGTVEVKNFVFWPNFQTIARPSSLAQDDTPMIAVVQHALAQIPGPSDQIVLLLQPTQPFRTPEHLRQAIALLQESEADSGTGGRRRADSVVSVVEVPKTQSPELLTRIHGHTLVPWQNTECLETWDCGRDWSDIPTRRQDAIPAYRRDGTVYAFWRKTVERHGNIYGYDVRPLIIPPDESCELDTEADWQAVERRWKERSS